MAGGFIVAPIVDLRAEQNKKNLGAQTQNAITFLAEPRMTLALKIYFVLVHARQFFIMNQEKYTKFAPRAIRILMAGTNIARKVAI